MAFKNYTTNISYYKTISEIEELLAKKNVIHVNKIYENQLPVAIYFTINFNGQPTNFKLPCNYKATLKILEREKMLSKSKINDEQALKISWRVIKDWISSQMALIETEMVSMEQVFLPYAIVNEEGDTVYDKLIINNNLKLLN